MTHREAWEMFYKTGRISDYITFLNARQGGYGAAVSGTEGENTDHAADARRADHPPTTDG